MDGLDLLKKDWKKSEGNFKQVTENEIYKMIHKNSSSIVKWIFIISLLEFALWSILAFCMKDSEVMQKFESYHAEHIMIPFTIIGYIALAYFFFQFFLNYKKISATDNSKKLIDNIIKTRKTVYQYVWFNIFYAVLSGIVVTFIQLNYDQNVINIVNQFEKDGNSALIYGLYIIITLVVVLLFALAIWLFYRLIYGILLKRLYKNYEELKKIDL